MRLVEISLVVLALCPLVVYAFLLIRGLRLRLKGEDAPNPAHELEGLRVNISTTIAEVERAKREIANLNKQYIDCNLELGGVRVQFEEMQNQFDVLKRERGQAVGPSLITNHYHFGSRDEAQKEIVTMVARYKSAGSTSRMGRG